MDAEALAKDVEWVRHALGVAGQSCPYESRSYFESLDRIEAALRALTAAPESPSGSILAQPEPSDG